MDKNEAVRKLTRAKGLALALVAASCTRDGTNMLINEGGNPFEEEDPAPPQEGVALCSVASEIYEKLSSVEQFLAQAGRK